MAHTIGKKKAESTAKPKQAPREVISICEAPGFLDHLKGGTYRVTLEEYVGNSWRLICSDTGNEAWLLEYPPFSHIAHYSVSNVDFIFKAGPEKTFVRTAPDPDIPF